MTPPMSLDELRFIAETLASGVESLCRQVNAQHQIENSLRIRLQQIAEKCEQLEHSGNSSSAAYSDLRDETTLSKTLLVDIEPFKPTQSANESVYKAQIALGRLRRGAMPSKTEIRKCPIPHQIRDQEDFEHDFTVPGKPSDLGCPFAKGGKVISASSEDPVAAEFHGDKSSTRSQDAGSRCPIRFLDQHSPEEIAKYFENHKHEIPRSHQICVRRYQQDEHSIRQLDAKYGNIVSMIQGLGNKHKQYLSEDRPVVGEVQEGADKVVEKWAENVSQHPLPENAEEEDERIPRFEKSLRDIRVGESPSRPWGIPVPIERSPVASVVASEGRKQPPQQPTPEPMPRTPAPNVADSAVQNESKEQRPNTAPQSRQTHIIFNGPVFFGYSPEQAAAFLQHLNTPAKD